MGGAIVSAAIGAGSAKAQSNAAARQNKKQRKFAEFQRTTAFQVGRRDMELAGINPFFVYGSAGGQGSAQSVSYGTQSEAPDFGSHIQKGVQSYLGAAKLKAEKKLMNHTAYKAWADANLAATKGATERAAADKLNTENQLLTAQLPAAKTASGIAKSGFGKSAAWIERGLEVLGKGFGIGTGGKRR